MKSRQEELDDLVREHLQDSDPGDRSWDLPSDKVWDAVSEQIKQEKRRRWGFWWVFGGMALLFTGVLWMALQKDSTEIGRKTPTRHSETPMNEGITNAEEVQSAQTVPSAQSGQNAEVQDLNAADKNLKPSMKTSRAEGHREHPVATQAANLHQIQKEVPLTGKANDNLFRDNTALEQSSAEASLLSTETLTTPSPSQTRTLANLESAHLAFLQTPVMLLDWKTPNIPQQDATRLITTATQRGTWSVAARLSPSLGTRHISVPNAQPRVRRSLLLQQEEPTLQPGFGLSVLRQVHPRWSIGLGVEYGSYVLNGSSTQQLRYTRAGERLNARGNFENRLSLHLNTSYGELTTDVVVERSSDAQIEENRFISLALETQHTMQEVRIPLTVGYHLPVGQWKLYSYAGLSANVMIENKLTFRAIQSLNNEIVHTSTSRNVKLSDARNVVVGYHVGCALEIPLERQWSILAGPSLSGSIEPVHENRHVKIYPMMVDVDLGVRYRF